MEARRRGIDVARINQAVKREARQRGLIAPDAGPGGPLIPADMGFRAWCEAMGRHGLKVDGHPFSLDNRQALWEIYDQIPTTVDQAFGRTLVLQKGSQMGLTVFETLADIYMAVKFAPCKVLMYLPDRSMAADKSAQRFLPILRTIPALYRYLTKGSSEGNILTRAMPELDSSFKFLWTSGRAGGVTESFPGDVLSLDETQGMALEQIDIVTERLSASRIKFKLMLSTPLWPELDIHAWYLRGDQRQFHSACGCADGVVLTEIALQAALHNTGQFPVIFNDGRWPDAPDDFVYYCPTCGSWVPDPQEGRWVAHNPGSSIASYHMSQILSPTITARNLIEAWGVADTAARRQNFFCRKLGTPFADANQVLATLETLRRCAEAGQRAGLVWKKAATGTYMGVDQMGSFSVVTIVERLPDGRMGVIHVEAVYALDPWARLDGLMDEFGVVICVIEQLPNIDSARLFSKRHEGKVWLITSYGDLEDFVSWGDVLVTKSDRKTASEFRDRYTLRADQYRVLDWAASRFREQYIVFPDPLALIQPVREGGVERPAPVLSDMFWMHYTKCGLVLEEDEELRKTRRKVVKLGLDPHAAFSLLAVCLAWFRAHGTSHFILPEVRGVAARASTAPASAVGLPSQVVEWMTPTAGTCGVCLEFKAGQCAARQVSVQASDPACDWFMPR